MDDAETTLDPTHPRRVLLRSHELAPSPS